MDGMLPILKELKNTYSLFVVSDHAREWWTFAMKKYKLKSYFEDMVFSFDMGMLKSDPKMLKEAIKLARVKPGEILFKGVKFGITLFC